MIGLSLTLASGQRPGLAGDPNVTAIAPDGWQASYADPPLSFPLRNTANAISVKRPGFDAAGIAMTRSETVYVAQRVRNAYSDQASFTPNAVALSDYVFAEDEVPGVSNGSALSYADCPTVAHWATPPHRKLARGVERFEVIGEGVGGRDGRTLARAEVEVKGLTSGHVASGSASALTLSSYVPDGLTPADYPAGAPPVMSYGVDVDLSGMTPGETVVARFRVWPVCGTAGVASTSQTAIKGLTDQVHRIDRPDWAEVYCRVDPAAAGASGTPNTDPDQVVAGSSYIHVLAAAIALHGVTNGEESLFKVVIQVPANAGTVRHGAPNTSAMNTMNGWGGGHGPVVVPAPGVARADAQVAANHNALLFPGTVFRGVTLVQASDTSNIAQVRSIGKDRSGAIFEVEGGTAPLIGCRILGGGASGAGNLVDQQTVLNNPGWTKLSYDGADGREGQKWQVWCDVETGSRSTVRGHWIGAAGAAAGDYTAYTIAGAALDGMADAALIKAIGVADVRADGRIRWNVAFRNGGEAAISTDQEPATRGLSILNCLITDGAVTGPLMRIGADGDLNGLAGIYLSHSTIFGARANLAYEDTAMPSAVKHLVFLRGCILQEFNHKDDTFAWQSGHTHTWAIGHHVGFHGNVYLDVTNNGSLGPSQASWLGEVLEVGSVRGRSSGQPMPPIFTDGTAGTGDFTLVDDASFSARPDTQTLAAADLIAEADWTVNLAHGRIAAGRHVAPFDLTGQARRTDGSGAAGAYERAP